MNGTRALMLFPTGVLHAPQYQRYMPLSESRTQLRTSAPAVRRTLLGAI
jgi:hypothetical protein